MDEMAWAAGFFDGEGSIGTNRGRLVVQITQAEPSTLTRFKEAVGHGTVGGPYQPTLRPTSRPLWKWWAYGRQALAVVDQLRPWLSGPKLDRAVVVLARPHSPNGYSRAGDWIPAGPPRRISHGMDGEPPMTETRVTEQERKRRITSSLDERQARWKAMKADRDAGMTLSELATKYGLVRERVRRILLHEPRLVGWPRERSIERRVKHLTEKRSVWASRGTETGGRHVAAIDAELAELEKELRALSQ
jgi:hypothetical protein